MQEVIEKWNKKILPHLPENLDELANKTGVIQRKRGVNSATDLLKILFLYACSKISFRILAFAACVIGILSSFIPFKADETSLKGVKNVLLADGSVVRQNGKQQTRQRIHMCYSLNQNRIQQVKVTDKHTAESLTHFSVSYSNFTRIACLSSRLWEATVYTANLAWMRKMDKLCKEFP